MSEFSLIQQYCKNIGLNHAETVIGVGDDAAIVNIPAGKELVISVDTLVEDVHFFADTPASLIAHKLVAVNLSDMAAMGAAPKWITLALTIPNLDKPWLSDFSQALDKICNNYQVQLIGGDTCQGPLSLSLQIMGLVDKGRALTRSKAQVGDDIYVSNTLGDAALALASIQGEVDIPDSDISILRASLDQPVPQVELGQSLLGLANACIDISDGLVSDLSHIAEQSGVTIKLNVDALPLSVIYSNFLLSGGTLDYAVSGGEDYQLAFSVPSDYRAEIVKLSKKLKIKLSMIGEVLNKEDQKVILYKDRQIYKLSKDIGYDHFSDRVT